MNDHPSHPRVRGRCLLCQKQIGSGPGECSPEPNQRCYERDGRGGTSIVQAMGSMDNNLRMHAEYMADPMIGNIRDLATAAVAAELEAGSRFVSLLPVGVARGGSCEPNVAHDLMPAGACMDVHRPGMWFVPGQRFLRLMTHPADARAGWHLVPPLGFDIMPLGMIDHEVRFDAFHWALSKLKSGLEGYEVVEQVLFRARAVLRAPSPRPMVHGLWVKLYDGRCRGGERLRELEWVARGDGGLDLNSYSRYGRR